MSTLYKVIHRVYPVISLVCHLAFAFYGHRRDLTGSGSKTNLDKRMRPNSETRCWTHITAFIDHNRTLDGCPTTACHTSGGAWLPRRLEKSESARRLSAWPEPDTN